MSLHLLVYTCIYICPLEISQLKKCMSRLHVILRVHVTYGRMAIGPRLTTGQYVMQFRFY